MGRYTFIDDLLAIIEAEVGGKWYSPGRSLKIRPARRMNNAEHLIATYDLIDWMNPYAKGSSDLYKQCRPRAVPNYTGLMRRTMSGPIGVVSDQGDEDQGAEAD